MRLHLNKTSFRLEIFPLSKDIYLFPLCLSAELTALKLDPSAMEKSFVSVFVPGGAASYKLSEELSVVFHHCSVAKHMV